MKTADEMRQLADALQRGATADIWADFAGDRPMPYTAGWRDYIPAEETERGLQAVDEAQAAMTRAATLLRLHAERITLTEEAAV